jgi:hypothetical protein
MFAPHFLYGASSPRNAVRRGKDGEEGILEPITHKEDIT